MPGEGWRTRGPADCGSDRLLEDADVVVDRTAGDPGGQDDAASWRGHSRNLSRCRGRIGSEDHAEHREHHICAGGLQGYRGGIALNEGGTNSALVSSDACHLKEPRCRINPSYMCASKRGEERGIACAAAEVDDPIAWRDRSPLHHRR